LRQGTRSTQVCEAFLKAGAAQYRKEGSKSLQKQLQRSSD